ncbi:NAD(+)/NADH kinase [Candidatus Uhrbacteria bacterium]|nr:NAD(+)/NADH kinase [Candidatus Uhrbacteria bacterium]
MEASMCIWRVVCAVAPSEEARMLAKRLLRLWDGKCAAVGSSQDLAAQMRAELMGGGTPMAGIDAVFVVGGDGFLLESYHAWDAAAVRPLFVGWNAGRVGFLMNDAPATDDAFLAQLAALRSGAYETEFAYPVCAEIECQGKKHVVSAFNEITVRACGRQAARLHRWIDGVDFGEFGGGGFIVATPQGSTAYAVDAGGPAVDLAVPSLILVPLTTHRALTFAQLHNALVLSPRTQIDMEVLEREKRPVSVVTETQEIVGVERVTITSAFRYGQDGAVQLGYVRPAIGRRFPARIANTFLGLGNKRGL